MGLHYELSDKIDSLTYCPGLVATKLPMKANSDVGFWCITPEKSAEVCFRDVGITSYSNGSVTHELHAW